MNLGYILSVGLALLIGFLVYATPIHEIIKIILVSYTFIFIVSIYSGAVNGMVRDIADYKEPGFKDFFMHLKNSYKISILFAFLLSTFLFICFISFSIYNNINSSFIVIAQYLIASAVIIIIAASQFFFPIFFGLDKRFTKIIKKMFLIFFDNPLFTFGLAIISIILFILSFFTLFMIPGVASLALLGNVGLKLRLYKYDYLEEHPGESISNSKIPWDTLLVEDREKVGKRTLKGMIFPWKD